MNEIVEPIGTANEWISNVGSEFKTILLDEPHPIVLEALDDEHNILTKQYKHSLDVCSELSKFNFKIRTFCRSENQKQIDFLKHYPFIDYISCGKWVSYGRMLEIYAQHETLFSFFQETFGFPIYETLQSGRPIISYIENANPAVLRQFQNAVLISYYQSPALCAQIYIEYIKNCRSFNFFDKIKEEAFLKCSTNTFCQRVVHDMQRNGYLID